MTVRLRMILDVDTGTDDAMALALAVRSPALELLGVTTVAGNVGLPLTTENTLRVLAYLGAEAVPVHRGFSRPLARELADAAEYHSQDGLGGLGLPPSPAGIVKPSAPDYLVETITAAPGEITLLCVGPLTNLAAAIALEPELPGALAGLVVMGGSLGPGNVTHYAEFNIYVDPEAAAQVFAACRLTMVGLDVTHRAALTRAAWERLAAQEQESATTRLVHGVSARSFRERARAMSTCTTRWRSPWPSTRPSAPPSAARSRSRRLPPGAPVARRSTRPTTARTRSASRSIPALPPPLRRNPGVTGN